MISLKFESNSQCNVNEKTLVILMLAIFEARFTDLKIWICFIIHISLSNTVWNVSFKTYVPQSKTWVSLLNSCYEWIFCFLSHLRKGEGFFVCFFFIVVLVWFAFLVKPASTSPPFPFTQYIICWNIWWDNLNYSSELLCSL